MGDVIVGAILTGVVALIVHTMWKRHKENQKSGGCSGNCGNCRGCH